METTEKLEKPLPKVYCSYGYSGDSNWIEPLGFTQTGNIDDADVVTFGGGKDIDPGFYGEKIGPNTCVGSPGTELEFAL